MMIILLVQIIAHSENSLGGLACTGSGKQFIPRWIQNHLVKMIGRVRKVLNANGNYVDAYLNYRGELPDGLFAKTWRAG